VRRAPLIVALAAGLALTGCGIPDNTDVTPLRPGPSTGVSAGDDTAPSRNMRADTEDPAEFVKNYLEAAAGDFDGAVGRVKQFLSPDAAVKFKAASTDIKVVRLTESPLVEPGSDTVKIKVEQVGSLRPKGILVPGAGELTEYDLTVREIDGQQGLFVVSPPPVLLLSDEALDQFYRQRTIYFWNHDNTGLVPDLRYMSASVPTEQEPTEVIDWLISGPSPWLEDVAQTLPGDTKAIGNVPAVSNATLRISLSGQAASPEDPSSLDRLQRQLRWSLQANLPGTLELSVEQQGDKEYTGTDYLSSNAAYREIAEPERFVVYNGEIRRLTRSYNSGQPVPVIAPEDNKGVRMAAVSSAGGRWWAALVVNESGGRQALRVGAAGPGEHATLRRIALPAPIGRPVWAKSRVGADDGTAGLVAAGGQLYRFAADGSSAGRVRWPGGPRNITAVAVAPDGHRVAVLAGGNLFVAALSTNEDGPQMSKPQLIKTRLIRQTAVDWSSETMLVVAGTRADSSRVAIMDISIDGATQRNRLADLGSNPVTYLAALPANPARGDETGAIAYMLGARPGAYDEVNPDRIGVDDLAEQVADPPENVLPTAPFFLN
jgi:hypothetical protein